MVANYQGNRMLHGAALEVDLSLQAKLQEFDANKVRGLMAPFAGDLDTSDMSQGIDVAQLAPPLLGAPSKLPPFALCDLVRDMEQGGKDVDVAYGPLVGCIEDGKRLKPGLLDSADAKKFEHRMVQYIAIRNYQHSFVTPATGKTLIKSGRAAKKADNRFCDTT
ncbi:hypothetical protein M885DRAFT_527284, partial [Pelagophyceae sp. CCMP2097]